MAPACRPAAALAAECASGRAAPQLTSEAHPTSKRAGGAMASTAGAAVGRQEEAVGVAVCAVSGGVRVPHLMAVRPVMAGAAAARADGWEDLHRLLAGAAEPRADHRRPRTPELCLPCYGTDARGLGVRGGRALCHSILSGPQSVKIALLIRTYIPPPNAARAHAHAHVHVHAVEMQWDAVEMPWRCGGWGCCGDAVEMLWRRCGDADVCARESPAHTLR